MKQTSNFNWDQYLDTTPYTTVLDGMGGSRKIIPTMFSPDKKLIYLKTYDLDFNTDDVKNLTEVFENLFNELKTEAQKIHWSCERLYLLQVDYLTVYNILSEMHALSEDYENPEYYLEIIMKEIGKSVK